RKHGGQRRERPLPELGGGRDDRDGAVGRDGDPDIRRQWPIGRGGLTDESTRIDLEREREGETGSRLLEDVTSRDGHALPHGECSHRRLPGVVIRWEAAYTEMGRQGAEFEAWEWRECGRLPLPAGERGGVRGLRSIDSAVPPHPHPLPVGER